MSSAVDHFLDAHPDLGPAWYRTLARVVGRAVTVPGLRRWEPLARRVHAVTSTAGRVTVLNGPLAEGPPVHPGVTVLCANLWHDWPRHQRLRERLEAFAGLAESVDADVLLLQEVACTATFRADLWLAERLGLSLVSARANGDVDAIGFEEGPAILSRFPLGPPHVRRLSHGSNPLVRRLALGVGRRHAARAVARRLRPPRPAAASQRRPDPAAPVVGARPRGGGRGRGRR